MKARSFSHCGITVSSFNRAVRFYWEVFGCPLVGVADTAPERVRSFFGVEAEQPRCKIGWLINTYLNGQAIVANGPILPNSWAYHDGTEQFEYDPEEAINLLKAEGYVIPAAGGDVRGKEGTSLSFTMLHPNDLTHTQIAQTIREEWAEIGVQVELQAVHYDTLHPGVNGVTRLSSRTCRS